VWRVQIRIGALDHQRPAFVRQIINNVYVLHRPVRDGGDNAIPLERRRMPPFGGQIPEDQIQQIVDFIVGLGTGTPPAQ